MQKNSKKNITGDEPPAEDVVIIHHAAIDYLQVPSTTPDKLGISNPNLHKNKLIGEGIYNGH